MFSICLLREAQICMQLLIRIKVQVAYFYGISSCKHAHGFSLPQPRKTTCIRGISVVVVKITVAFRPYRVLTIVLLYLTAAQWI